MASIEWEAEDAYFEFVASGAAHVLRRTNVEALLALPLVISRQLPARRRGNSRGSAIALNIVICGGRFFVCPEGCRVFCARAPARRWG